MKIEIFGSGFTVEEEQGRVPEARGLVYSFGPIPGGSGQINGGSRFPGSYSVNPSPSWRIMIDVPDSWRRTEKGLEGDENGLLNATEAFMQALANKGDFKIAAIQSVHTWSTPPPISKPHPPVDVSKLATLADLIEAHEKYYFNEDLHSKLNSILKLTGKVNCRGEEWWYNGHYLCHSETAPGGAKPRDRDGNLVVYTDAANLKLEPLLARLDEERA